MNARHTLLRTALLSAALLMGSSQAFASNAALPASGSMVQQIGTLDAQLVGKTDSVAASDSNTVARAKAPMFQKVGSHDDKSIGPKDTSMAVATVKTSATNAAVATAKVPSKNDVTAQAAALMAANTAGGAHDSCGEHCGANGSCGEHCGANGSCGEHCGANGSCGEHCGNHGDAAGGKSCCGDHATDTKNDAGNAPAPVSASLNGKSTTLEGGCGARSNAS